MNMKDYCDYNQLSGNIIEFNSRIGIWVYRGNNNTISENIVSNNGDHGIMSVNCLENYILENIASYNTKSGIFLLESKNTTIWANTVERASVLPLRFR